MGHGPNGKIFGGSQGPNPEFLNLDPEIFYCPVWLLSLSVCQGHF